MDGLEVCRRIRKAGNTPVMMLTAKGETFDKVLGLELGADDYMVKPFDAKEVVARIKAVLRRCQTTSAAAESTEGVIEFDNLRLDMNSYELRFFHGIHFHPCCRAALSLVFSSGILPSSSSLFLSLCHSGA